MKKIIRLFFMSLLLVSLCFSCKTETGDGDTYITNNINIVWKGSLETAPSNPKVGWAYYNSTEGKSYIWDGSSWQIMAQDGKSIIWKGELSSAPENPEENWAYFNIIDGNSYIYNGNSWDYLAKSGKDGDSEIMLWLGTLESAPESPNTGYCYYNSLDKCSYIWDGDSWEILTQDGTAGEPGASIVWKGALSEAPENPEINWVYYNTSTQSSYIYNGSSWDILSESIGGDTTVYVSINWLGTYSAAPADPTIGDAYYNSTSKASYVYDGSVWQQISKDGTDGKDGINGQDGKDGADGSYSGTGYLITWKGSLETAPSNPEIGWAYYNSTEGKSYIWDGSSWQIMAQDGTDGIDGADGKDGINGQDGKDGADGDAGISSVIYIGESTDTVDEIEYVVKSYADVYANDPHFFTYYKYYYLNDNLRKIYIYGHGVGSCLLYDYTNYEVHECGMSGGTEQLYEYYENGQLEKSVQKTDTGALVYHYSEAGKKESMSYYTGDVLTYVYTYYESGNQKSLDGYTDGVLTSSAEYFDLSSSKMKSLIHYNSDGSLSFEQYYYSADNEKLSVSYNTDGSVDYFNFYYESGYLKYCYYDSDENLYTYEDGKTKYWSTSSDDSLSKEEYTDEQAKNKISELKE